VQETDRGAWENKIPAPETQMGAWEKDLPVRGEPWPVVATTIALCWETCAIPTNDATVSLLSAQTRLI
jgi:hypothetical protein